MVGKVNNRKDLGCATRREAKGEHRASLDAGRVAHEHFVL
jgi:hypothetical protein